MKTFPSKCHNCGKSDWTTSGMSHFLSQANKTKEGEYQVKETIGMIVHSFICNNCNYVVFFKEKYDKDLR